MSILIAFDMDGTLTKEYSWNDLVRYYGDEKISRKCMEDYFKGKISYEEWVNKEIELFIKNELHLYDVHCLMREYTYVDGLDKFLQCIYEYERDTGIRVYRSIISAGIYERAIKIKRDLGFDFVYATKFRYDKCGYLEGMEEIVDPLKKLHYLEMLKVRVKDVEKIIVIGDSDFDVPMMGLADVRISVNNRIETHDVDFHGKNYLDIVGFLFEKVLF